MITEQDILKIAKLSQLELSSDEVSYYQKSLTSILEYAKKLDEVQDQAESLDHNVIDTTVVGLRSDHVDSRMTPNQILENASEVIEGHIKVPAILGKST